MARIIEESKKQLEKEIDSERFSDKKVNIAVLLYSRGMAYVVMRYKKCRKDPALGYLSFDEARRESVFDLQPKIRNRKSKFMYNPFCGVKILQIALVPTINAESLRQA
jgi:hypothetical protein